MNWIKKLFARTGANELEVVDKRSKPEPIIPANIVDEDDPIMAQMLGAAMQSGKPVMGNFKNGKLIIKDV